MKKLIVLLMLIVLPVMSYGEDIAGQNNTVILSDYITGVYNKISPVSIASAHRFFDSTRVIHFINVAREDCANTFQVPQRDTTILIVAGTEWYSLPSDFNRVRYVASISNGTGEEVAMKMADKDYIGLARDDKGSPSLYLVDNRQIQIVPANNANDSVIVHYLARTNILSNNTDTCNIDKEYKQYIALRASEEIYISKASGHAGAYATARAEAMAVLLGKEKERLDRSVRDIFDTMVK